MEDLDFFVNEFMQAHKLTVDDLYNYLTARKERERMIPLSKETLKEVKAGMYWYDDDTVSETYYPDRKLKSLVLVIYEDSIIGDTFHESKNMIDYPMAMHEIVSFASDYIIKGNAHKPTSNDLYYLSQNLEVINQALKAIGKPIWRFSYWTDSINKYEDDWYKKEQKWHYIIHVNNYRLNQTAPDFEKAQARPLLRFALK
jgi:hypothetical protein